MTGSDPTVPPGVREPLFPRRPNLLFGYHGQPFWTARGFPMNESLSDILAKASIPSPKGMSHLGVARIDVHLRTTKEGRFRWFRTDGTPTVVDGASVDQAIRVAQMIWRDVQLNQQPAPR
jgi:hypothetical protein